MMDRDVVTGIVMVVGGITVFLAYMAIMMVSVRRRTRSPQCRECGVEVYRGSLCSGCREARRQFMQEWSR